MSKRWECRKCAETRICIQITNGIPRCAYKVEPDWCEVPEPVTENTEPWVELPDESRWPYTWHGIYADVIRPALVAIKQLRRRVEGSEKDLREEVFSRCECERLIIKRLEALERGQG